MVKPRLNSRRCGLGDAEAGPSGETIVNEETIENLISALREKANEISNLLTDHAFNTIKSKAEAFATQATQIENTLNNNKDNLGECYSTFLNILTELKAKVKATADAAIICEDATTVQRVNSDISRPTPYVETKRLKSKLPSYDGDLKLWREYWEAFCATVHDVDYAPVDKIKFLFRSLTGDALEAVRGYSMIAANYETVCNVLKERFGDESKLVAVYYSELENLPTSLDSKVQRKNLDHIRRILTNLELLGSEVDQDYLKSVILKKFNRETLKWTLYSLVSTPGEKFTIQEMIEMLNSVIQVDELVDYYLIDSDGKLGNKRNMLAGALVSGNAQVNAQGKKFNTRANNSTSCIFCSGHHKTSDCRKYATVNARKERITKLQLCFYCLSKSHKANSCPRKEKQCIKCHQNGHAMHMCFKQLEMVKAGVKKQQKAPKGSFLETFICFIRIRNNFTPVKGVIDSCSQYSFVSKKLISELGVATHNPIKLDVCLFGTTDTLSINSSEAKITLANHTKKIEKTLTFKVTPCITGNMLTSPPVETVKQVLPNHLKYADVELFQENKSEINMILGNNYQFEILTGKIKRINYGIILRESLFGWIPTGEIRTDNVYDSLSPKTTTLSLLTCTTFKNDPPDNNSLENLWNLETLGIKNSKNEDTNDQVIEFFRHTLRFENGRYIVRWPWKQENPRLPSNFRMCMARLKSLLNRSDLSLLQKYDQLLKEQLQAGIIEEAPRNTTFLVHYLPHRALEQKNKLRVVYDASAKTKTGSSLNDLLHKGPVLLGDLVGLLLNFRIHEVGLTADIEKAFLQVGLNEVDRDVVRFIWVKDVTEAPNPTNIIIYRFARVPFGVISSPFLLNIVLNELLSTPPTSKWHIIAKQKFYVDNLVVSVKNTSDAIELQRAVTSRLKSASMNLRDWTSNDQDFRTAINHSPLDEHAEKISILGLNWDRLADCLFVKMKILNTNDTMITKRLVLQILASIFDPLGLFGPCTLPLKLFLQLCWKNQFDWDTPLPADLFARWIKIYNECKGITNIPIPRRYWANKTEGNISLHIFCDASKNAYAICSYLLLSDNENFESKSSLIYAKIKVSPPPTKKQSELSIPKLELLAVLIGSRASKFLKTQLDIEITNTYIWTDATTVLQWLNTNKILPKFIQNRIIEIKQKPNLTFRYIPTEQNPADIASRGCSSEKLKTHQLWWNGPNWLPHESLWPSSPENTQEFSTPVIPVLAAGISKYSGLLTDQLERKFSIWGKYVRIFKNINRFRFNHLLTNPPSSLEEFQHAELLLIREIQKKYFSQELKLLEKGIQPNWQLKLFLKDGIIRCTGRIQNAAFPWDTVNPILLPRKSPLTEIIIRKLHVDNLHIGYSHLLAKLRERFWVIKAGILVKSVIHKCGACRRWSGGSYSLPPMPPLPLIRVAKASPFLHCGIDYLGFITYKNENNEPKKCYICLFVCLVTRAVHLEIARDLSGAEFLMALIRFGSRRGCPKAIITDNATNFTFVQPLVGRKVNISNEEINSYLNSNNIAWKFIPQYSPWQGGAYERLVANVKSGLKKAYGTSFLDYVQLSTVLCELENIINCRPLTYTSSDEILTPLSPNHFLRLRTINALEQIEINEIPSTSSANTLIKSWSESLKAVDCFWDAFRSLYLLSLREKHSAVHKPIKGSVSFIPKIGDVVLVKEPSAPRAYWKFGIIKKLDKRQAIAEVRCEGKIILRSINLLYPLEIPTNIKTDNLELDGNLPQPPKRSRLN